MPWLCNCGAASTRHGIIVSSFARQEKVRKLLHPPFFPLPRERDLRPRSMIVRSYTHMHSRSIWASVNFITNRFMEISRDSDDFYGWERNHGGGKQFPRLRKGKSPKGKKEGEDKRFFLHCLFSVFFSVLPTTWRSTTCSMVGFRNGKDLLSFRLLSLTNEQSCPFPSTLSTTYRSLM